MSKYRAAFLIFLFCQLLVGCGLLEVKEQQSKIDGYCRLYGTVAPEIDDGKKLIVG
jgi:hypothetical protein